MVYVRVRSATRRWQWLALSSCVAAISAAAPAHAAFHLWAINEIYTNSSGTLQFIELVDTFGSQNVVGGQQIRAVNLANTITNTFNLPAGSLAGNTLNHSLLFGTAGIQAAGGPAPDYIIPNGFLFQAGGTLNFFGLNSGPYAALPTDGDLSRTWTGGGNAVNSPRNYAGVTGHVPEPAVLSMFALGGACLLRRRRGT